MIGLTLVKHQVSWFTLEYQRAEPTAARQCVVAWVEMLPAAPFLRSQTDLNSVQSCELWWEEAVITKR
jgi:hypothetical protein